MFRTTMILLALALIVWAAVPAMAWEQIGSTDTAGYLASETGVPTVTSSGANFSRVGSMPAALRGVGGVVPDFKVTYDLIVIYDAGWGNWSMYGNNGLALFVGATPSGTSGLFTGVSGTYDANQTPTSFFTGAVTGNSWTAPWGTGNYGGAGWQGFVPYGGQYYGGIYVFNVSVEKVGSTATTTVTNMNSNAYTVTTADATNWTGGNFAAYHCYYPGYSYGQSAVTNIAFYAGGAVAQTGTVSGYVHLNGTTPGVGATVRSSDGSYTTQSSDGNYSLSMLVGTYTMVAHLDGYADQTVTGVVVNSNATTTQNFKLAGGTVSGTVRLNGTNPASGAIVYDSALPSYTATTASDGTYSLHLAPGTHTMVAHLNSHYADQTVTGVAVVDETTTTQNFKLAGGKIAGTVTLAGVAPGVAATVRTADSTFTTTTGTDGSYSLSVPPGTYSLVASKTPFSDATASGIVVTDEATTTQNFNMALALGPGQAGIVGRVTSALGGAALPDATVKADTFSTHTDVTGTYALVVTAGDYEEFGAMAANYTSQIAGLTIASGTTINRNFALVHGTTWDLSSDYSTVGNPNGQWSFGIVDASSNVMTPYPTMVSVLINGWPPSWTCWSVAPPLFAAYGLWLGKNTTGNPIVVRESGTYPNLVPSFVVDNGDMSFGGQGAAYGRSAVRWNYPYGDQRFMNIHVDLKNHYCAGTQQPLHVYQNGSMLTTLNVSGFAGFAGTAANGYTDSVAAVPGTPTLAYDTALLFNPGDVIDFAYTPVYPDDIHGYRMSINLGVIVSPGTGVVATSLKQIMDRPEDLNTTVALTSPTILTSDINPPGGGYGFKDHSFYVQAADRSMGMKCLGNENLLTLNPGTRITMTGKVTHDASGMKVFKVDAITSQTPGAVPAPIGIGSKGVAATMSAKNMLVRVWGKLTQRNPSDIGNGVGGIFLPPDGNNPYPWNYWVINDGGQDIKMPMNVQSGAMCPPYIPNDPAYQTGGWSIGDYISVTGVETLDSTGQLVVIPQKDGSFLNYTANGR